MGFLTRAQIIVLRDKRRNLDIARDELRMLCREYSDNRLHSQACIVGGMSSGACNGLSGSSPCPCGAEDPEITVEEAYRELNVPQTKVMVLSSRGGIDPDVYMSALRSQLEAKYPGEIAAVEEAAASAERAEPLPESLAKIKRNLPPPCGPCEHAAGPHGTRPCPHMETCTRGGRNPFV
jgi:hypothetical protein